MSHPSISLRKLSPHFSLQVTIKLNVGSRSLADVETVLLRVCWARHSYPTVGACDCLQPKFCGRKAGRVVSQCSTTKARLADYQARYQLKSVINLRGTWPNQAWFSDEASACSELGLKLRHVDLRSYKLCRFMS